MDAVEIEELVRRGLAHDLHDGLGVKISTARMHLSSRYESSTNVEVQDCVRDCLNLLDEIHQELRSLLTQLAPAALMDGNLADALQALIRKIEAAGQLEFTCDWGEELNELNPETATQLYRIIQELLNNTIKHSQAQHVSLSIWVRQTSLELEYTDDGNGFDPEKVSFERKNSFGLTSIRGRVQRLHGTATFESTPGEGMTFYLSLPLP